MDGPILTGVEIVHEERCASSNDRVLEIAAECPGEPVAMRATVQTAARGRLGRPWVTQPGGMWLSLAWPATQEASVYATAPLLAGLAVADSVESLVAEAGGEAWGRVRIKWPNDLLVDAGKLGGILCERRDASSGETRVIVGIGVNARSPGEVPRGVDQDAPLSGIGLFEAFGIEIDPGALARATVDRLCGWLSLLEGGADSTVAEARRRIEPRIALLGEDVRVQLVGTGRAAVVGRVMGVDEGLRLVIEQPDGELARCDAGEVQRLRADRGRSESDEQ